MSISTNSRLQYIKTYTINGPKVEPKKAIMTHYAVYFEDGSLLDTSILEVAEQYAIVNLKKKNAGGYTPQNLELDLMMRLSQVLKKA